LLVNVVGSLVMGMLMAWLLDENVASTLAADVRPFVAVGVLGGFTTFSSFSADDCLVDAASRRGEAPARRRVAAPRGDDETIGTRGERRACRTECNGRKGARGTGCVTVPARPPQRRAAWDGGGNLNWAR
jgi:hypothetical protein